jgi:hypothetical protein
MPSAQNNFFNATVAYVTPYQSPGLSMLENPKISHSSQL